MLAIPGRDPVSSRCQYVLDLSRHEIVDYLFERISDILHSCPVEYVKWDMNRNISDIWSAACPAKRQGEVLHRYILGVYSLLEQLTGAFPDVLWETCSGGGGRFDAGMLYYSPQIWCSDNTDPIERLRIQYGTSFIYPLSCIGAHVSASPNHQTGRSSSMGLRGLVAMTGAFGYELHPSKLTPAEKEEVSEQIRYYRSHFDLFSQGDLFHLSDFSECSSEFAWMVVSSDQNQAVVSLVLLHPTANAPVSYIHLRGLRPEALYRVDPLGKILSGQALMSAGLPVPELRDDQPFIQYELNLDMRGGNFQHEKAE